MAQLLIPVTMPETSDAVFNEEPMTSKTREPGRLPSSFRFISRRTLAALRCQTDPRHLESDEPHDPSPTTRDSSRSHVMFGTETHDSQCSLQMLPASNITSEKPLASPSQKACPISPTFTLIPSSRRISSDQLARRARSVHM